MKRPPYSLKRPPYSPPLFPRRQGSPNPGHLLSVKTLLWTARTRCRSLQFCSRRGRA
jgi:hypothetical protein